MATAHSFPTATTPAYSRAELEALMAAMDARCERATAAHHWSNPTWGAVTYARQIWSLACDCLVELDGEEPESSNPQAELADVLDVACQSVWNEMQRHLATRSVRRAAA